jgi:hypothetical protein
MPEERVAFDPKVDLVPFQEIKLRVLKRIPRFFRGTLIDHVKSQISRKAKEVMKNHLELSGKRSENGPRPDPRLVCCGIRIGGPKPFVHGSQSFGRTVTTDLFAHLTSCFPNNDYHSAQRREYG